MPCLAAPARSNVATCCASSAWASGCSARAAHPGCRPSPRSWPKTRAASRHCILLWMSGGPSQTDTFDMKPGHANGGEFKEVATNAPGLRFSEHLPKLGEHADRLAVIRSLSTKEGDHGRGTHLVRTGHPPMGGVEYPSICCSLAKELEVGVEPAAELRQRRAAAAAQPGRVRARLPRPEVRAGRRRRRRRRADAARRRKEAPTRRSPI